MTSSIPNIKLNDGNAIPAIGFQVDTKFWKKECTEGVLTALKNGYRYIETVQTFMNAKNVKEALQQWDGKREEVYIVAKIRADDDDEAMNDPRKALDEQLKVLGVDYVNLCLIYSPYPNFPPNVDKSWKIMELLKDEGKTKSIGVSNFSANEIVKIVKNCDMPPAVNLIEHHPYIAHIEPRTIEVCKRNDIIVMGYGGLASLTAKKDGPVDVIVDRIAGERGITAAQVLFLWSHQSSNGGGVVITSNDSDLQKELLVTLNADPLSASEVQEISNHGTGGYYSILDNPI